jgi:hypothetical protein
LEIKWTGREGNNSSPTSAEVKNNWSYISTPSYVFVELCIICTSDSLTFTSGGNSGRVEKIEKRGASKLVLFTKYY